MEVITQGLEARGMPTSGSYVGQLVRHALGTVAGTDALSVRIAPQFVRLAQKAAKGHLVMPDTALLAGSTMEQAHGSSAPSSQSSSKKRARAHSRRPPQPPLPEAMISPSMDPTTAVANAMLFASVAVRLNPAQGITPLNIGPLRDSAMKSALAMALGGPASPQYQQAIQLVDAGLVPELLDFAKGRSPMNATVEAGISVGAIALVDSMVKTRCCGLIR
jgi:hypothetical protein